MLGAVLHCMFGFGFVLLMIVQFIVLNLQCQSLHPDESGGHGHERGRLMPTLESEELCIQYNMINCC